MIKIQHKRTAVALMVFLEIPNVSLGTVFTETATYRHCIKSVNQ